MGGGGFVERGGGESTVTMCVKNSKGLFYSQSFTRGCNR